MGGVFDLSDLQSMAEEGEVIEETVDQARARYVSAMHAMESGVAVKSAMEPADTDPRSLRAGINSALLQESALARLLIKKGIITEGELLTALADGAEQEVAKYQAWVRDKTGADVTLQ